MSINERRRNKFRTFVTGVGTFRTRIRYAGKEASFPSLNIKILLYEIPGRKVCFLRSVPRAEKWRREIFQCEVKICGFADVSNRKQRICERTPNSYRTRYGTSITERGHPRQFSIIHGTKIRIAKLLLCKVKRRERDCFFVIRGSVEKRIGDVKIALREIR